MPTPRPLLLAGALAGLSTLACSSLGDRIMGAVADQMEGVLADVLEVDPSEVDITPLPSGRWEVQTPGWKAECGMATSVRAPANFLFELSADQLLADCAVNPSDCEQVFGLPCDGGWSTIGIAMVLYPAGSTTAQARIAARTTELEGKGLTVTDIQEEDEPDMHTLMGARAERIEAVAVVGADPDGVMEILVAPTD